ncbi:MAG: hypothetical protein Ct9H90mP23_0980 [Methanobacteriota archaeon]|nr:MAG: hypothetical protein Ct9H90mP23_0980 [Euryarchaeota archaeon]
MIGDPRLVELAYSQSRKYTPPELRQLMVAIRRWGKKLKQTENGEKNMTEEKAATKKKPKGGSKKMTVINSIAVGAIGQAISTEVQKVIIGKSHVYRQCV